MNVGDMVVLTSPQLGRGVQHDATCVTGIVEDGVGVYGFPLIWLECDNGLRVAPKAVQLVLSCVNEIPPSWAQIKCSTGWRPTCVS